MRGRASKYEPLLLQGVTTIWILLGALASVAEAQATEATLGACRSEPGLIATSYEVENKVPYCRTKIGDATTTERDTPIYWKEVDRALTLVPYVANLENSAALFKSSTGSKGDTTTTKVLDAIRRAANTWNAAAALEVAGRPCSDLSLSIADATLVKPDVNRYLSKIDGKVPTDLQNSIVWRLGAEGDQWPLCAGCAESSESILLASTQIIYNMRTGEISDADISINGVDFVWVVVGEDTPELFPGGVVTENCDVVNNVIPDGCVGALNGAADVQAIITHELGHLIGFSHVRDDDPRSIMVASNSNRRSLSPGDVQGLCETYPYQAPTPLSFYPDPNNDEGGCNVYSHRTNMPNILLYVIVMLVVLRRKV